MIKAFITEGDLSVDDLIKLILKPSHREGCGAIVTYVGYVKAVVDGERVEEVVFEVKDEFEDFLNRVAEEVAGKYGLHDVIVAHKEGALKPGETVMYVVVSAVTRDQAFRGAREIVDRIKSQAPMRKVERREGGTYLVGEGGERRRIDG
ncbi:MAG: molybdenum cofactor biosynthesis protein MoaE [Desulfurococcales archaeon]|nr:molybdenum cofactor biosynthesis protein MoaE [Desulfurococcales archaeon]